MRKKYNQLSLSDIYENCNDLFNIDKSKFINLLENSIDFADFIPLPFYNAFNQHFGRNRKYSLSAFTFTELEFWAEEYGKPRLTVAPSSRYTVRYPSKGLLKYK